MELTQCRICEECYFSDYYPQDTLDFPYNHSQQMWILKLQVYQVVSNEQNDMSWSV